MDTSIYDANICMAGWDGDRVYTAPEYRTDIERKTFTLCRADISDSTTNFSLRQQSLTTDLP